MQIFVVKKDSNVAALLKAAPARELQQLQRLNPHLDFQRIKPGAMIILPDAAAEIGFPGGSLKSIGAEAMESFGKFASEAMKTTSKGLKQAAERAKTEEAALASALRAREVSDALAKDPALKAQAEEASSQAKADVQATAAEIKAFDKLSKAAAAELAVLEKRLR